MLPWWPDVTIVQSDVTIVVPWQLSTGSKHDYLFCYCPLVGILFEVLRNVTPIFPDIQYVPIVPDVLTILMQRYQYFLCTVFIQKYISIFNCQ